MRGAAGSEFSRKQKLGSPKKKVCYYVPLAKWLSCVPILSSAFHITASFDERDVLWPPHLEIRLSAEVLCNLCNDDYVIFIFFFKGRFNRDGVVCISLSEWL